MSGRFLVDTNFVVALLNGDTKAMDKLATADEIFLSTVVLGELFYGAYKSHRRSDNLSRIIEFAANNVILDIDIDTSRHFGTVKNELRQKGRPIPENDVWIAAVARQHDLAVLTRDVHFSAVDALERESW